MTNASGAQTTKESWGGRWEASVVEVSGYPEARLEGQLLLILLLVLSYYCLRVVFGRSSPYKDWLSDSFT